MLVSMLAKYQKEIDGINEEEDYIHGILPEMESKKDNITEFADSIKKQTQISTAVYFDSF